MNNPFGNLGNPGFVVPPGTGTGQMEAAQQQRLLMAQAQAQQQARAQQVQALQAAQREDEMLMRLLLQRNQQRRELALQNAAAVPPDVSFAALHGVQNPAAMFGSNPMAAARLQAQQEFSMMDHPHRPSQQQLLLMEQEAATRAARQQQQGLRNSFTYPPLDPQQMAAMSGGAAHLAALQDSQVAAELALSGSAVAAARKKKDDESEEGEDEDAEAAEALVREETSGTNKRGRKKKEKDEDRPRRALSAYNLFFAEERAKIVKEIEAAAEKEDEDAGDDDDHSEKTGGTDEVKKKSGKVKSSDIAAKIGSRWKALPEEQRKHYQELAQQDAERQKVAMEEYIAKKVGTVPLNVPAAHANMDDDDDDDDDDVEEFGGDDGGDEDEYAAPVEAPRPKRAPKDKDAPKRPGSAFLLFSNSRRKLVKQSRPDATNAELSKILSKLWKEAPDDVRAYYMEKSQEMGKVYKVEMAQWRRKVAGEKKAQRAAASDAKPSARRLLPTKNNLHQTSAAAAAATAGVAGLGNQAAVMPTSLGSLGLMPAMGPGFMYGAGTLDPHMQAAMMGQSPFGMDAQAAQAITSSTQDVARAAAKKVPPKKAAHATETSNEAEEDIPEEEEEENEEDDDEVEEEDAQLKYGINAPPKRPMSAFLAFSEKRRSSLKKKYPYARNSDLSKMLSKTWKEAPDNIREKYKKEASKQYQEAVTDWKNQKGDQSEGADASEKAGNEQKRRRPTEDGEFENNESEDEDEEEDQFSSDGMDSTPDRTSNGEMTIADQMAALYEKNDWDAVTVASRAVDLCRIYDWSEIDMATKGFLKHCRTKTKDDLAGVVQRAEAIDSIRRKIPVAASDSGILKLRKQLVPDFIAALKVWCRENDGSKRFDKMEYIEKLFGSFVELSTAEQFQNLEAWAEESTIEDVGAVESVHEIFGKIEHSDPPIPCRDTAAKKKCAAVIASRQKTLRIETLEAEREELAERTKDGEPQFTWSCPLADTGSVSLDTFLHSPNKGPVSVDIDDVGDANAVGKLIRRLRFRPLTRSGQPKKPRDIIKAGCTVDISHAGHEADSTIIVVTKRNDYHLAKVNAFRQDMARLRNVCISLRALGVPVVLLGNAGASAVSEQSNEEAGAKKSVEVKAETPEESDDERQGMEDATDGKDSAEEMKEPGTKREAEACSRQKKRARTD